ncbi:MAG TPA: Asp-tRNA(Asn)/Glu-tRNA(Gln) amidotransferase subunit GatA [Candidatus Nanoarchaeia archaeon]|nr:glutamyl-tRNA(Gln) amidotransferase subunit A [uncultured archaeon]
MHTSFLTIKQIHEGLKKKDFSSVEVTKQALQQAEKADKDLGSFLTITGELALKQAQEADRLIANSKEICWLTGVPMGIKDVIVTQGVATTAASKILEDFLPPYSATVYENLLKVKAVMIGKLNCDEFAMGASTENSAYQKTKNPWDRTRVPGGSSGGSAAAVAAGLLPYALGTDTGGSIRQPASFCSVVGLKPTYGRVSRWGLIPMGNSLDQAGPLTQTVEDAAWVLNIIAGYDRQDATSVNKPLPDYSKNLGRSIKGKKFGIPKEYLGEGIDPQVKEIFLAATKKIEDLGGQLVEVSLPHSEQAIPVYYLVMASEVSTNLARYDGVRYGGTRDQFGPEAKRRIMLGTYSLSSGYYDAYYLKSTKVRRLIYNDFQEVFKKVDFVLGPTSPVLPFKFGEKIDNPLQMYLGDILTVPQNLAGVPAISLPAGFVGDLPVGLQITANHWEEEKMLQAAYNFEQATEWHKRKPE